MDISPRRFMISGLLLLTSTSVAVADESGQQVSGQQIVEQGNDRGAMACATCHGKNGAGNGAAGFPRLAGLHQAYISKQLNDYKTGKRNNPIMAGVARALNDADIKVVSSYFANLKSTATPTNVADKTSALGEKLSTIGNWEKDIPACFRCHGDGAQGGGPVMPALAGQHQSYIRSQLQDWKSGTRNNDPLGLMAAIASRMSKEEIDAVSAYLANLKPAGVK